MGDDAVDLVRRGFEAFLRGEEGFLDIFHPSVEWTTAADEPDQQTYRGIDGVRELVAVLFEQLWERNEFEVLSIEYLPVGDRVVVPVWARLRARLSGIELEAGETYVFQVSDGAVVRVMEYRDKEQALAALGAAGDG